MLVALNGGVPVSETSPVVSVDTLQALLDETATLSNYPKPVRQLVVTGLGRDAATVIITNDRTTTAKQIIERYARRMNIEQLLAESIRSFHTDALAGSVPLDVDLDGRVATAVEDLPAHDLDDRAHLARVPSHPESEPIPVERR